MMMWLFITTSLLCPFWLSGYMAAEGSVLLSACLLAGGLLINFFVGKSLQ